MPTGYTAPIADGIGFEQFVWSCARAFGALVMLRDDSSAPIPDRFAPSDTYRKWADEERSQLARLEALTPEEVQIAAAGAYEAALASWRKHVADASALREKYEEMLAKVQAWQPPTPDHVGLRDFMQQQLQESIRFDCSAPPQPQPQEAGDWHTAQLAERRRLITRYEQMHAEEVERTEGRNQWLKALRESVPAPKAAA